MSFSTMAAVPSGELSSITSMSAPAGAVLKTASINGSFFSGSFQVGKKKIKPPPPPRFLVRFKWGFVLV
jgi:hypothetical protein